MTAQTKAATARQIKTLEGAIASVRAHVTQLADAYAVCAVASLRETILSLHDQGDAMQAELDSLQRELLFSGVPSATRALVAANID